MDYAEYEKMYRLEQTYWWFQGRMRIVLTLLEPALRGGTKRLVDLGCGTGMILDELTRRGRATGLDFSPRALEFCRRRGLAALAQADVTRLPVATGSADVVTALDITEHVEDDQGLVSEAARILRPGGHLLITVPAHRFLWSEHDVALWHKRRYSRRQLLALFADQPLRVLRCSYAITFTFPAIVVFRLLSNVLPHRRREARTHLVSLPRWVNGLLRGVLSVEAWLLKRMNLPFGVTLVVVAERLPEAGSPRRRRDEMDFAR